MNTKTTTSVLSTGEAIALGDLLTGLQQKLKIEWLDEYGDIRKGELRSLVKGPNNFDFLQWGTDVRDGYVWITANGMEHIESVRHLVTMLQEGGCIITPGTHVAHNSGGTAMVRIEGNDLELLRKMLTSKGTGLKPYLLRVDQRGESVAFKVNEQVWTHGMGKPQPPY